VREPLSELLVGAWWLLSRIGAPWSVASQVIAEVQRRHPCCSAVGDVSSRTCASPRRSFALTGFWLVQPPRTCAMCVSDGGGPS
jgi:hypothetical protein